MQEIYKQLIRSTLTTDRGTLGVHLLFLAIAFRVTIIALSVAAIIRRSKQASDVKNGAKNSLLPGSIEGYHPGACKDNKSMHFP